MENTHWWISHIIIIVLQIVACFAYIIGSWRFYKKQKEFLSPLAIGIICDILITIVASSGILPRMEENQGVPWKSWLFITHISTASFGMFGFIFMWIYIVIKKTQTYAMLRSFQFWVLLPSWCIGVMIALINFIGKVTFQIRIYDFI